MDDFQAEVTRIALKAASPHGFALAGGGALVAHGIVRRSTEDVDLFTDSDDGVLSAAGPVEEALTAAGLNVEVIPDTSELGDVFEGFEHDYAEFEVTGCQQATHLTLARFDRLNTPVLMDVGPVIHVEDALGSKMVAMITRAEPRDFIDVAAASRHYEREFLVSLALRADPTLTDEELRECLARLDRLDDAVFTRQYGLTDEAVAELRAAFMGWSR